MDAKQDILQLIESANMMYRAVDAIKNIRSQEQLAKRANGYHDAANVILNAFPELHNEMIDLSVMLESRRFRRLWNI